MNKYLHSVDEKCNSLLASVINELTKKENITEELKATNQLEWVARMNNIKNRAEEIVYNECICLDIKIDIKEIYSLIFNANSIDIGFIFLPTEKKNILSSDSKRKGAKIK